MNNDYNKSAYIGTISEPIIVISRQAAYRNWFDQYIPIERITFTSNIYNCSYI